MTTDTDDAPAPSAPGLEEFVNAHEAAARLGLNVSTVSRDLDRFEKAGRIKTERRGRGRYFSLIVYDRLRRSAKDPAKSRKPILPLLDAAPAAPTDGEGAEPTVLERATVANKIAQTQKLQLDIGERAKTLIDREATIATVAEAFRATRGVLEALPDRVASPLATLDDSREVARLLREEINRALAAISAMVEKLALASPPGQ